MENWKYIRARLQTGRNPLFLRSVGANISTKMICKKSSMFGKQRGFLPSVGCVIQQLSVFFPFSKIHEKSRPELSPPPVVVGPRENVSGSVRAKRAHRNKKISALGLELLANISKSNMDLRLKFEPLGVYDLMKMMHSSDHDFGAHRNQKNWIAKKSWFLLCDKSMVRSFFFFFFKYLMINDEPCCKI